MAGQSTLDRLAELLGVEPCYHDIWGKRQDISDTTKRDLIRAMGFGADTEEEAAASLRDIEERPWRRSISPVGVLDQGGYAAVEVMLPQDADGVGWTLRLEDGSERSGGSDLSEMEWLGERRIDGRLIKRWRLPLPQDLPLGYHTLTLRDPLTGTMSLIVAPRRCLTPEDLFPGRRLWGMGVQLYGLRSDDNWGVGDFGDLGRLAEIAGGMGADVIGLNPLHSLFPADPHHFGPYSPSDRAFLNVLYIDVAALCREAGQTIEPETARRLEAARGAELVDYPAVAALKTPVLEKLFVTFEREGADGGAFESWRREQGEALEHQALFDALHEHFFRGEGKWHWHEWPEDFRHPEAPGARAFAEREAGRVTFFAWLQWLADRQLGQAAERGRAAGLSLGFYRDLAVGTNPGGAASWSLPSVILDGASVGAPPDMFNPKGQNWGIAPLSPLGLIETAYRPFIRSLRANMRHAGAIRIDHAMAIRHLFWIPARKDHEGGAYVRYPERDLLRLITLESHRNRCAVIGEALGTVPEGFREELSEAGILSYELLYFERDERQDFKERSAYPADALVSVTTHDLPTLKGWWSGHDLEWRRRLGLFRKDEERRQAEAERRQDRDRLLKRLTKAGLWPAEAPAPDEATPELVAAVHRFLAETPGWIMLVQIEDAVGEIEQPNLPGTTDQHPNWRRKLPVTVDELPDHPLLREVVAAVREGRSHPVRGGE